MRNATARWLAGAALTAAAAAMLVIPAFASATPTTVTAANTTYSFDAASSTFFFSHKVGGASCPPSGGVKTPAAPANHNPSGPVGMQFRIIDCTSLYVDGTLNVQGGSSAATLEIPTGKLEMRSPFCLAVNTKPVSIPGTWTNGSVGSLLPSNFSAYSVAVPVQYGWGSVCGPGPGQISFEIVELNMRKTNPFDIPLVS